MFSVFKRKGHTQTPAKANSRDTLPKYSSASSMDPASTAGTLPDIPLPPAPNPSTNPAQYLRSIYAVREQAKVVLEKTLRNELKHFKVDMEKLQEIQSYVSAIIKRDYAPNYSSIPPHGRWQHLEAGGVPRLTNLMQSWSSADPQEKTRRLLDLTVVSVLLDAGAGSVWKYQSSDGGIYRRSEGLAVASLDMFKDGLFSSDPEQPFQVDGKALKCLEVDDFRKGFQVSSDNPMEGLNGRAEVLIRLGSALDNSAYFGTEGRPGNMLDYLLAHHTTHAASVPIVALPTFWNMLMDGLTPIWPASRTQISQTSIGDAWPLSTLAEFSHNQPPWKSIMPFHKLTQWLCYSLMVPMTRLLCIRFAGSHLLTGLAEYRNGGLLMDCGLLTLRSADAKRGLENYAANAAIAGQPRMEVVPCFDATDEVVVEWRAVTVGILDLIVDQVNKSLGLDGASKEKTPLTLAQVLEAGTWKGGREIAAIQRPNTQGPPIMILSDGTVF